MTNKLFRTTSIILLNIIIFIALLSSVEGLSSFANILLDYSSAKPLILAERLHTKYDPDLGWINIANKHIPDIYGKGKSITINSQSFRSNYDYTYQVPRNKKRIICSGDSFTFGYGVSNEDTWCSCLSKLDKRIESINMGLGGFGIDQSYLWYLRDGVKYEHDIHIFAFIKGDFDRMFTDNFMGYAKPVLSLVNGNIKVNNVPVPKKYSSLTNLVNNQSVNNTNIVKLAKMIFVSNKKATNTEPRLEELFDKIVDGLITANLNKNRKLILLYLPTYDEYTDHDDSFRNGLSTYCKIKKVEFIDLTPDFVKLEPEYVKRLFVQQNELNQFNEASGHYSELGHEYVAQILNSKLANTH